MADTFVVINNKSGKFLGHNQRWVSEYPDATIFRTVTGAVAALNKTDRAGFVVENYGRDDEGIAYESLK